MQEPVDRHPAPPLMPFDTGMGRFLELQRQRLVNALGELGGGDDALDVMFAAMGRQSRALQLAVMMQRTTVWFICTDTNSDQHHGRQVSYV